MIRASIELVPPIRRIKNREIDHLRKFAAAMRRAMPGRDDAELYWGLHFALAMSHHTIREKERLTKLSEGQCDLNDVQAIVDRVVAVSAMALTGGETGEEVACPATVSADRSPADPLQANCRTPRTRAMHRFRRIAIHSAHCMSRRDGLRSAFARRATADKSRFAPRNDVARSPAFSRHVCARGLPNLSLQKPEGAGKTGCALHPRSRVQDAQRKRTRAYRFSGNTPAFPAQWFYGLYRALPGDRAFLPPSPLRSVSLSRT